ncbi:MULTISPECIES: copper resistance CopC family protein [Nocardia]|uniref:copper resistance CopC family protein n=1 Tax=Nocardia TaxID=1817 RepID=UPI0005935793|nr:MULTISPECIES: copper resistance CopC family protein [Nocardia]
MARAVVVLIVSVTAWIGAITTAAAHSELIDSDPAPGAVLAQAPAAVTLTFNQKIGEQFATVILVGANDTTWHDRVSVDGTHVRASVRPAIPSGDYTVGYRVVSADGHPISGSFRITVTATADTTALTPPASPPAAAPAATAPPAEQAGFLVPAVLAAVLVVLVIAAVVVLRRSRKTR